MGVNNDGYDLWGLIHEHATSGYFGEMRDHPDCGGRAFRSRVHAHGSEQFRLFSSGMRRWSRRTTDIRRTYWPHPRSSDGLDHAGNDRDSACRTLAFDATVSEGSVSFGNVRGGCVSGRSSPAELRVPAKAVHDSVPSHCCTRVARTATIVALADLKNLTSGVRLVDQVDHLSKTRMSVTVKSKLQSWQLLQKWFVRFE